MLIAIASSALEANSFLMSVGLRNRPLHNIDVKDLMFLQEETCALLKTNAAHKVLKTWVALYGIEEEGVYFQKLQNC
jgi:hypothetical protein